MSPLLLVVPCIGIVDLTDSFHSILELGSELSRELLPLSLLTPGVHLDLVSTLSTLLPLLLRWGSELSVELDLKEEQVSLLRGVGDRGWLITLILSSLFNISLTLLRLGTGGFTTPVDIKLLTGPGDFKIPLGPLFVVSVTLPLLFVCLSLGLSEPLISFCLLRLMFLFSRFVSGVSDVSDLVTSVSGLCLGVVPGELSSVLELSISADDDTCLLRRLKLPVVTLLRDTETVLSAVSSALRNLQLKNV